ncbi:junctional cadherin 5-associated protein isoform X2 [Saccopteryx bilineata]|uniref:junctional cadherin 5-associated protein isoform X2 n=1 Tax=Saccopteryx bilineata TaxID=59482 RepID=UPI00339029DD
MYSVEDLLISHGYKLSREFPAPAEGHREGYQPVRTRARGGHGLRNGCEDGPAAFPHSKASLGTARATDAEKQHHVLRAHGEPWGASAAWMSEDGFDHQPVEAWSSQPQSGHNHAYWTREQEVSGLRGPGAREDPEVREMARAHSLPVHTRLGPWEVGGRTENVMKEVVWEEDLRRASPAKWQDVSRGSWNQSRKLERQTSEGAEEKLFQDLYPFVQGEHVLTSQSKGKSRSLPRVLSPKSLAYVEIPLSDGHLPDIPKMPFYPPNWAPDLESERNSEKGGSSVPVPWPKFGRPLKPPSYDSHPHFRGGGEHSDSLDSQQVDASVSHRTRPNDSRQELGLPDAGLEPPVYVPPPSYRSPAQHVTDPYSEDVAPTQVWGSCHQPAEESLASLRLPASPLGPGGETGESPPSPRPPSTTGCDGSVLYISFDDPRVRHIKLAPPHSFCEEAKVNENLYSLGLVSTSEPQDTHHSGAILSPQNIVLPSRTKGGPALADPSRRWLWGQLPRDGENDGSPDQSDHNMMRGQWCDGRGSQQGQAGSHISLNPLEESACETQTKLRKFETGIQTKKSSKKKINETIFCLVSVPVKSESHLPATDTNNNDVKPGAEEPRGPNCGSAALQEQRLLSASSTDLELQALTGHMAGAAECHEQDLGDPDDRPADVLHFACPVMHRELQCSGLWPAHQYKDQQTQTTFTEESKSPRLLPAEKLGGSPSAVWPSKFLSPAASEALAPTAVASGDQHQRPSVHHLPVQPSLHPSSCSAFTRTSVVTSQTPEREAGCSQPCVDSRGRGASPESRGEVVKGATTGPCNSQQLFGQFLLKPVSRRPWDLISQLESFNKELQEEEESSHSEDSETEGQPENCTDLGLSDHSWAGRVEEPPGRLVPEEPAFGLGGARCKSEKWSEEQKPAPFHLGARPQCPGPSQVEDHRGQAVLFAQGSLMTEKRNQLVGKRMKELAVSPGPVKRMTSCKSGGQVSSPEPVELREPRERQELPSVVRSVALNKAIPPKPGGGEEVDMVVPLSLASKPRGLSAPDLRSVGLTVAPEWSALKLDRSSAEAGAIEIPPNESLQERAARILGIEVAVESLMLGARRMGQNQHPEPDGSAQSSVSLREDLVSSPAQPDDSTVCPDAFSSRRKCGWTESPLFVGERDSARRTPETSEHSGVDRVIPSTAPDLRSQPSAPECKPFNHKDMGTKPPYRSTLFHFIERTPSTAGSEKRLRSTSRVIESLQEKLVSQTMRATPDRLRRMKEVRSVSRMRLLSSRSADSAEGAEEELRVERGPTLHPGGLESLTMGDPAWKVGNALSVSKGALSLGENGHLAAGREKNSMDQDFGPDLYDPSRVERV